MSELVDNPTPDYVETQQSSGTKRVNRLPVYLGAAVVTVLLLVVGYNVNDSAMKQVRAEASEVYQISSVGKPPVERPAGPDVNISKAPIYNNMPVEAEATGAPMQEAEAARKAREKRTEMFAAALVADSKVDGFSNNQTPVNQVSTQQSNSQRQQMGMPPPPPQPGQQGDGMGGFLGGGADSPVRNHAGFNPANDTGIYLGNTREAALSPLVIQAGFIIPGVMISGINSDLPGPIIGQVQQDVYDSVTGQQLLIPAASKLFGTYDSQVVAGEERVLIAWNYIKFPDGSTLSLNNMPGADQIGQAGFNDQVDNHYFRTFGQALLLSALSAGMQIGMQPRTGSANGQLNATQIAAAATSMQFGMLGMQAARRGMNTPPTMEIRPGFLFNIVVTKDIILPPWRGHPAVQKTVSQEVEEETSGSSGY